MLSRQLHDCDAAPQDPSQGIFHRMLPTEFQRLGRSVHERVQQTPGFCFVDVCPNLPCTLNWFADKSWTHRYTGTVLSEVPSAFAVQRACEPSYPGNYYTWQRLERPASRLNRRQITVMLCSAFWRTVMPAKYTKPNVSLAVREVQNVNAWFRLVENLKRLG